MIWYRDIYLALVVVMFLFSCGNESSEKEAEDNEYLRGKWKITNKAFSNEEKTDRLDGLYFEFTDDEVKTNILGTEATFNYARTDNIITQSGEIPISYNIETYDDTTMNLQTTIRNYDFRFTLRREFMAPAGQMEIKESDENNQL